MSFSFGAKGATKSALLVAVAEKMADVVKQQPEHAHDQPLVNATVSAYLDLVEHDETKDLYASVSGSLSWSGYRDKDPVYTGAGIGVNVNHITRE